MNFQHSALSRSEKTRDHSDALPSKQHQVHIHNLALQKTEIFVRAIYSQLGAAFVFTCSPPPGFQIDGLIHVKVLSKIGSPSTHFQILLTSVLILSSHSRVGVGV